MSAAKGYAACSSRKCKALRRAMQHAACAVIGGAHCEVQDLAAGRGLAGIYVAYEDNVEVFPASHTSSSALTLHTTTLAGMCMHVQTAHAASSCTCHPPFVALHGCAAAPSGAPPRPPRRHRPHAPRRPPASAVSDGFLPAARATERAQAWMKAMACRATPSSPSQPLWPRPHLLRMRQCLGLVCPVSSTSTS